MKAFQVTKFAHPKDILPSDNVPAPELAPNEILVDVYSAGLNFFDILQATGKYQNQPPMPFILGSEFAGRISKNSPIPPGCSFKPGDKIFGSAQGSYAEQVAVDVSRCYPIPNGMSYDQAAGLFLTWPTAYEGLTGRGGIKSGDWVLVHGAAGGVGLCAVQIAKALGGKVIATAGSPSKLEVSLRYGADHAINYRQPNWQKEVLKITGGKGVDIIYDPVGLIKDSLKCIAWKGRALVIGFAGGQIEKLPLNLVLLKNISIVGLHWGEYLKKDVSRPPEVWKELFELWKSKRCTPIAYPQVFHGLEGVSQGLVAVENRETWGKAVVKLRDENLSAKL
ncbi:NAD(P)-binding protein [Cantharellus anzutake]|uniref:NAD(P)-binding protein n=1 Tax=Cantharellus anzutake TaxID=1750568 RepID=UPI0019034474|nr:NAD(P)-binding protein [Cantharellus anzutake]KAF8334325.1 NAD(P)-binding protein [Cantharellus anzutake]